MSAICIDLKDLFAFEINSDAICGNATDNNFLQTILVKEKFFDKKE
jgi:hypothetical protein